ncbi:TNF receptor-associated factor homolog 1b-like protein [Drosera capensis]
MGPRLSDRNAIGKPEGMSTGKGNNSGEELDEWRSSEQLESGVTSTSSSCYGSDDDEDGGSKPSKLYGKYTWKIQNFSKITKRDIRSNAFGIGGHKWCISIYPEGCEVSNHLSLFLCVSNHENLLPGWSQLAQFTVAVVNNDPKNSKYSDTVHRFRHKEHDWGWKKFLELSKLSQGFVDKMDDTLTIKAQIQVIREKADRPFRCLACQYKREVLRIYLTNVAQICRKFVKESRLKLGKLLEDKARWSSFCTFWLGVDQSSKSRLSRENMDMILREIVKRFTIGKEVVATLVMESLYSGLRELEGRGKTKNMKGKLLDGEDTPPPIIRVEKDMFILADDALMLLEQAASEPLPSKDEKGPQNHFKDGSAEEDFSKESSEQNERLLTYFGRRMIETFVLARIFSNKIEIAYQYDVALKMQEELIREEEKAGAAKSEQKAMHAVSAKEKKSRKKLGKQQRNGRKGKDKAEGKKGIAMVQDKQPCKNAMDEETTELEKGEILEDASDISSSVDDAADMYDADSDDRDGTVVTLDSETSDIHLLVEAGCKDAAGSSSTKANELGKGRTSVMDDSSSTTSTDSVHSVSTNGSLLGKSFRSAKGQNSFIRMEKLYSKVPSKEGSVTREADSQLPETLGQRHHNDVFPDLKMTDSEKPVCGCLPSISTDGIPGACKDKVEIAFPQKKRSNGVQVNTKGISIEKAPVKPRSTASLSRLKSETRDNPAIDLFLSTKAPSSNSQQTEKATSSGPRLTEKSASSSKQQTETTTTSRRQQIEKEDRHSTQRTEKAVSASTQRTQEAVFSSTQQTEKAPLFTNMPQSSSWSRSDSMKANGHKPPEKNFGQLPSAGNQRTEKAMFSSSQKTEKVPLCTNMPQSPSRSGPDSVKANGLKPPENHFGQLPSTNMPQSSSGWSRSDSMKANGLKPPEKLFGQIPSASTQQTEKAMPSSSQKIEKVPLSTNLPQSSTQSVSDSVKANGLRPPEEHFGQLPSGFQKIEKGPLPTNMPQSPGWSVPDSVKTNSLKPPAITESTTPVSSSLSEAVWAGPDPTGSYAFVPQSHRSAITCTSTAATPSGFIHPYPVSSTVNSSPLFLQPTTVVSAPMFLPRQSDGADSGSIGFGTSFGLATRDIPHTGPYQMSSSQQHISQSMTFDSPSNQNALNNFDLRNPSNGRAHVPVVPSDVSASTSGQQTQGVSAEEFPHLHIITDLLDDEQQGSMTTNESRVFRGMSSLPELFNQRLNVSGDMGMLEDMASLDSSSPFARSSGYYDGFGQDFSSCGPFDSSQELIPQANLMPYSNDHINDWNLMQVPVGGSDFSSIDVWSSVSDGYSNYFNGYTNPSMHGYSNYFNGYTNPSMHGYSNGY